MYEESLKSGIKDFFFNAQGRFSRETFIVAYSALSLFAVIVSPLFYMLCGLLLPGFLAGLIILIYGVYLLYAHFVICIKRLHDLNLTGWLSILTFCFPLSFLFIAYLVIQKGRAKSNKYGKPLNYTGPSFILNASYVFLILYAIFVGVISYFFVKGVRTGSTSNTGQGVQQVINALPKAYQKEVKKPPEAWGFYS